MAQVSISDASGPQDAQRTNAVEERVPQLDVDALRHAREPSRLGLLMVGYSLVTAVTLVVAAATGDLGVVLTVIVITVVVMLMVWALLGLWRVHILGDAVKVSQDSLPMAQQVIDDARDRLGYHDRLDVFVSTASSKPVELTHYFTVRVLILKADVIGDLTTEDGRRRLAFVLGGVLGVLRARNTRWSPLLLAFELTPLGPWARPFSMPWHRATTLTGDRLGYACCGDLQTSLDAVARLIAGESAARQLLPGGVLPQALHVRRSALLRLSQMGRATPHVTNRYLELLAFAAVHDPDGLAAYRARMADPSLLDRTIGTSPAGPSRSVGAIVGLALSTAILGAGVATAAQVPNTPTGQSIAALVGMYAGRSGPEPSPEPTPPPEPSPTPTVVPTPTPQPTPEPTPTDVPTEPTVALVDRVPPALVGTCHEAMLTLEGSTARVVCEPASGTTVEFHQFATLADMQGQYDDWTATVPTHLCAEDLEPTWYYVDETLGGEKICSDGYPAERWWTYEAHAILAYASDDDGLTDYLRDNWVDWAELAS
jgi:hypothetical protein